MRLQAADHGAAGAQSRQEWLWGQTGGAGLRPVMGTPQGLGVVEEQEACRITLWIVAWDLP